MVKGIAFAGRMCSGKSTAADHLISALLCVVPTINRISFAASIKRIAVQEFGLSYNDCYTTEGKMLFNNRFNMTNRAILQKIGEGMRASVDLEVWIKIAEVSMDKAPGVIWCIDDLRYANEAAMVKSRGGIVVQIIRESVIPTNTVQDHASEVPIPSEYVDVVITNDFSLTEFLCKITQSVFIPYFGDLTQI